jgi:hypothetical protein
MTEACITARDEMLETAKFLEALQERFEHSTYSSIHDKKGGAGIRFTNIVYRYADSQLVDPDNIIPTEEYRKYTLRKLTMILKYYLKKKVSITIEGYVRGAMIMSVDIYHGDKVVSV